MGINWHVWDFEGCGIGDAYFASKDAAIQFARERMRRTNEPFAYVSYKGYPASLRVHPDYVLEGYFPCY